MNDNPRNHELTQTVINEVKNNAFVLTFDESGKMILKIIEPDYLLLRIEQLFELIDDDLMINLDFSLKLLSVLNKKINRLSKAKL